MKAYKTRTFARLTRNTGRSDQALCEAIERAVKGLVDAELGTGLVKQRVARQGQGRFGGYRTVIALCARDRAFFLHCFAKTTERISVTVNCGRYVNWRRIGLTRVRC